MNSSDRSFDDTLLLLSRDHDMQVRLQVLRELFEDWYGPVEAGDGLTEEELSGWQLPMPLHWLFRLAGRRPFDLASQNCFIRPDQDAWDSARFVDDGKLLFYSENQGVYLWATATEGKDPPVWGRFNEDGIPWSEEGMTLSEFLIEVFLFEAAMTASCGASAAGLPQEQLDEIIREVPELPLKEWRWPSYPSRFYARKGVSVFAAPNNDNPGPMTYSIYIGAISPEHVAFLESIIEKDEDDTWEHVAIG